MERKGEKNKYPRLFARAEVPISSFGKGTEKGEDFFLCEVLNSESVSVACIACGRAADDDRSSLRCQK